MAHLPPMTRVYGLDLPSVPRLRRLAQMASESPGMEYAAISSPELLALVMAATFLRAGITEGDKVVHGPQPATAHAKAQRQWKAIEEMTAAMRDNGADDA